MPDYDQYAEKTTCWYRRTGTSKVYKTDAGGGWARAKLIDKNADATKKIRILRVQITSHGVNCSHDARITFHDGDVAGLTPDFHFVPNSQLEKDTNFKGQGCADYKDRELDFTADTDVYYTGVSGTTEALSLEVEYCFV